MKFTLGNRICIVLGILSIIILLIFRISIRYIVLWSDGLRFHYGNDSYLYNSETLNDEYRIDINLGNISENIGKVLFEDEDCKIVVSNITNNDNFFEILFRSYGSYSIDRGVLVSGIKHIKTEKGYSSDLVAKAYSEYYGKVYEADVSTVTNMNYKDGDEFGFYIFPYKENFKEGYYNVTLSVENLCKNEWLRK